MLTFPFIQVAGVIDPDEASLIQACGVRYLGFPLRLPVHEEDLSEAAAAELIRALRPGHAAVLITYLSRCDDVLAFAAKLGVRIVQLHGEIEAAELQRIKQADPRLAIIKSLVVGERDTPALEEMIATLAPFVDAFITDTFDPATGASGATGRTHDWDVSRRFVALSPRPVILAGGLTPENVREAIAYVRPAGVDVHTGVEDARGRKSEAKLRRFVTEVRAGIDLGTK